MRSERDYFVLAMHVRVIVAGGIQTKDSEVRLSLARIDAAVPKWHVILTGPGRTH